MELRLIDTIKLENGLILKLYDSSRRVVRGRWLVCFVALVDIQVKPEYFESEEPPDISFDDIRSVVGQKVTYRHEKTRNFVAETEPTFPVPTFHVRRSCPDIKIYWRAPNH